MRTQTSREPERTRDPEKTRARILEKATALFSKSGFEGCAVDDIVKHARVNKRMVYHYFGDKKGLYREVLKMQWTDLRDWLQSTLPAGEATTTTAHRAAADLPEALAVYSKFLAGHQDFVRLMMWEALEGGAISRSLWGEVRGPVFHKIAQLISEAQKQGNLQKAIDPGHLVISFLGIVTFYFAYAPTIVDILGKNPLSQSALQERENQVQLLLKSLISPT